VVLQKNEDERAEKRKIKIGKSKFTKRLDWQNSSQILFTRRMGVVCYKN
jgi:hypothetical protein